MSLLRSNKNNEIILLKAANEINSATTLRINSGML